MEEIKHEDKHHRNRKPSKAVFGLIMFLLGALTFFAYRFAMVKNTSIHFHANFSLYVNGQQDKFSGPGYYEEVTACNSNDANDLKSRVHLHDQNAGLVHVHSGGVTWGQLFDNLGYTLGDAVLVTESGMYTASDTNKLTFMLNGQKVSSIANRLIGDRDVLLISYGNEDDATLQKHYDAVPRDAEKADTTKDPAACKGSEGLTFGNRVKEALGIKDSSSSHSH